MVDYNLTDYTLLELIKKDNHEALEHLLQRYHSLVVRQAARCFIIGGDKDDLIQEGMIGLYQAAMSYDKEKSDSFKAFATLCVTRHIHTAIKAATRKKHNPLNTSLSLDRVTYNEAVDQALLTVIEEPYLKDPLLILMNKDQLLYIETKLKEVLSSFEQSVLVFYSEGYTYEEIGAKLGKHHKSVDNALQRIKTKLKNLKTSDTDIREGFTSHT